jgi:hypothetical protein
MRKESFFPIYCDVLVSFDIFMPSRLQQKYSSTIPGVETFHVKLMYDDGMLVVYIHYTVDGGNTKRECLAHLLQLFSLESIVKIS